jgi:hypothetical protein
VARNVETFSLPVLIDGLPPCRAFVFKVTAVDLAGNESSLDASPLLMITTSGCGGFGAPVVVSTPLTSLAGMALVDLNRDSLPDIVLFDHSPGSALATPLAVGLGQSATPFFAAFRQFARGTVREYRGLAVGYHGAIDVSSRHQRRMGTIDLTGVITSAVVRTGSPPVSRGREGSIDGDGNSDLLVAVRVARRVLPVGSRASPFHRRYRLLLDSLEAVNVTGSSDKDVICSAGSDEQVTTPPTGAYVLDGLGGRTLAQPCDSRVSLWRHRCRRPEQ